MSSEYLETAAFRASHSSIGQEIAIVATSEEVAHGLASPVLFLRNFVERVLGREELSTEDREIALEELARLAQLLASLRECRLRTLAPRAVPLLPLVQRACLMVPRPAGSELARVPELRIAASLEVLVDEELVWEALCLALSCATAAGSGSPIVIAASRGEQTVSIEFVAGSAIAVATGRARPWTARGSERDWLLLARAVHACGKGAALTLLASKHSFQVRLPSPALAAAT